MKFFFCRHKKLYRRRAHPLSEMGLKYRDKAILIDKHGCYVFISCAKCDEILKVELDDHTF